jgi:hypothetical protein
VQQRVASERVVVGADGMRRFPAEIRYVWPSELDLMAQLAGLSLRERWEGWDRERFSGESGDHVSLYAKARSPA